MRKLLLAVFVCLVALPSFAARRSSADTIVVGSLFSSTGAGATLGRASEAAFTFAVRDLNEEFEELRLPYRVWPVTADTNLSPSDALNLIAALHGNGAMIVIGPQTSAEAAAIRDYANEHGIIVISQASTASSLAIAGDHLFRFAPNDRLEGAAIAALMRADGIEVAVPLWRADTGQTGIKDGVLLFFEGVKAEGVSYDPATTDFTATVNALGTAVRNAKNANRGKKVGIVVAAFEEGAVILDKARLDPDLLVNWYSGDGLTKSQALLANANAAAFAEATNLTAPAVALNELTRDRWEPLSDRIEALIGFAPDAFSLSVYDAVMSAVLASVEARNRDGQRLNAFLRTVQRYWGVTGPLALDAAGDRRVADFDFWTVKDGAWVRTAGYVGGRLVR